MANRPEDSAARTRRDIGPVQWIDHRLPVFTFLDRELNNYPTPRNLNYWWNFGSLKGTDAFIPANPLQTPSEIVPHWYLLPFYAILRSIPDKLVGVAAMFSAVGILFFVPWLDTSKVRSAHFRPIYKWVFWLLVVDAVVLGWVGAHRPEGVYVLVGRVTTLYYFFHFLILMPLLGWFERPLPLPSSIASAVLPRDGARAPEASRMERP